MSLDPFLVNSQESVQPAQSVLVEGSAMFGGRFVLKRHLGQGGMGQVWLAQDTTLDQPRALKFVIPALLSDASARKRLRNEARLGTELAHPRIVRVFDFVEETGGSPLAAVVMEFVEGRTLSDLLAEQENGFFEPEDIEKWLQDIVEGLRYAHDEKQRYHLDLKPGNIIIETASGRAKLLDFGISRSAKDTITRLTGQPSSGTLPYMSPQQLDGEPPCAADDVYSLGATVYELLTGTPPFFRGKLDDQIRHKEPDSLLTRRRQNMREGLNAHVGVEPPSVWARWTQAALSKSTHGRVLSVPSTSAPAPPKMPARSKSPPPAKEKPCPVVTMTDETTEITPPVRGPVNRWMAAWWVIVIAYAVFGAILTSSSNTGDFQSGQWFLIHGGVLAASLLAVKTRLWSVLHLTAIAVLGQFVILALMFHVGLGDALIVVPVNAGICLLFLVAGLGAQRKAALADELSAGASHPVPWRIACILTSLACASYSGIELLIRRDYLGYLGMPDREVAVALIRLVMTASLLLLWLNRQKALPPPPALLVLTMLLSAAASLFSDRMFELRDFAWLTWAIPLTFLWLLLRRTFQIPSWTILLPCFAAPLDLIADEAIGYDYPPLLLLLLFAPLAYAWFSVFRQKRANAS
jgi:serine/threonine protein kinase